MRRRSIALARRLSLLGALTILLALLASFTLSFGVPHALAAGSDAASGTGAITGSVENGTHANVAVAGQPITLQLSIGANATTVGTTRTDAQGHFSFTGLDVASSSALGGSYAVYTTYQGGTFASGAINLATNPTQSVTLLVYDATQDSANLSVSVATILVRAPDVKHGLVGVGEFITMRNSGTTAFVGSLPSTTTGGAMPPLLRFSLPANAQNVTTGVGFFNTTAIQVGSGFGAAVTVPPGQTEFAFAYDMPYTGTTLTIPYKAEYATAQVVALVPPNMLVRSASGVAAQGIVTAFGARYQVYTANTVAHDAQVAVNLYDLPQPGEPQDLNASHLLWLALALLLALAALLALYLWRGALATTLGLIPAAQAPVTAAASAPDAEASRSRAAERERLLRALLALERRHAGGSVSDEQFKREEAALRERLRALLAEETPMSNPASAEAPAAEAARTPAAPMTVAEADATAGAARVASGGGQR